MSSSWKWELLSGYLSWSELPLMQPCSLHQWCIACEITAVYIQDLQDAVIEIDLNYMVECEWMQAIIERQS